MRPEKGKALLFFPSFADGTSDPRSLHTAEDAVETKWVTQQWVARGLAGAAFDPIAAALAGSLPLGSTSPGRAAVAAPMQQPRRSQQQQQLQQEEAPSAAELAMRAGKRSSKGKKAGGKGGKPASKGFGG